MMPLRYDLLGTQKLAPKMALEECVRACMHVCMYVQLQLHTHVSKRKMFT